MILIPGKVARYEALTPFVSVVKPGRTQIPLSRWQERGSLSDIFRLESEVVIAAASQLTEETVEFVSIHDCDRIFE